MKKLLVSIEKNGRQTRVGTIEGSGIHDAVFCYDRAWLDTDGAIPVSLSLPLREEAFSPEETRNYFEGLLPEGFTKRSVAKWMQADENDYLTILSGLGQECLGAIQVMAEGVKSPEARYVRMTEQQMQEFAAEGAVKSAEIVTALHLSLTGASGKTGLYLDDNSRLWYFPEGTAPSTHIVKQSHIRLYSLVTNEQLSLRTASRCGISIPNSFIINTGNGEEREVLFVTERFDRVFTADSKMVDGLRCPNRLHQEDFAQAMGIHSLAKYEQEPDTHMKGMFDILWKYSSDPVSDQMRLWDIIVFDYLIGNTDAHIKNFSLRYDPDLQGIRLAPAYDIVSTVIYDQSTRDMAFRIGGVHSIDEITSDDFRAAAADVGLGGRGVALLVVVAC